MSDTPETDYEINYKPFGFYTMGGLPTDAIGVEFARQLERERDAFEKELAYVRDVLLDALPHIGGSTKKLAELLVEERDKHQEQADALVDQLGATQERMIDAERERDLWKENSQSNRDEYYRLTAERDKFSKVIASFQDTVFDLRAELDVLKYERDLWKAEAERWRALSREHDDEVVIDDQTAPYGEWWETKL